MTNRSDREFERAARTDPYYAVVPQLKFRRAELSRDHVEEFFASGEEHLNHLLSVIRKHFEPDFTPTTALDYGCGTGRLVIPLARVAGEVVAADVSPSMLSETRANCERLGIRNVRLVTVDDQLTQLKERFDFVYSTMVFQHIPRRRVEKIVRALISHLKPDGFGSLHFLSWMAPGIRVARFLTRAVPLAGALTNVLRRRPLTYGYIDMRPFSLDRVGKLLCDSGIREAFATLVDDGTHRHALVTFRRPGA